MSSNNHHSWGNMSKPTFSGIKSTYYNNSMPYHEGIHTVSNINMQWDDLKRDSNQTDIQKYKENPKVEDSSKVERKYESIF